MVRASWVNGARVVGKWNVVAGASQYRVMPAGQPEGQNIRHEKQPFGLPVGWSIASAEDTDFDQVVEKVIAQFGWSTNLVICHKGTADSDGFAAFFTKNYQRADLPRRENYQHGAPGMQHDTVRC